MAEQAYQKSGDYHPEGSEDKGSPQHRAYAFPVRVEAAGEQDEGEGEDADRVGDYRVVEVDAADAV